jgi:multidrug resistance efflux pump
MGELQAQRASEQGARLEYASLPDLAERGFVTRNELEAARLTYEEVKASTSSFRAGVEAAEANVQRADVPPGTASWCMRTRAIPAAPTR